MDTIEAQKVLDELQIVRPEKLNDAAKRLFDAIMIIADERDKYKSELVIANKMIESMIDYISMSDNDEVICAQTIDNCEDIGCKACIKKFFKDNV